MASSIVSRTESSTSITGIGDGVSSKITEVSAVEVPVNPLDTGRGRGMVGEDVKGTEGIGDGASDGALDGGEVGLIGALDGGGVRLIGALDGAEVGVIGTVWPL